MLGFGQIMIDPLSLGLDLRRKAKEKKRKNIKIYETNQRLKTRLKTMEREREWFNGAAGERTQKWQEKRFLKNYFFLLK
jgi:hypothetical protein